MINGKRIDIWLQMTGFEKNDPDRGAARYIESIGFTPDSVCPLLFHPDFIHYHRGMDKEYTLLRANCAYYGVERTTERERQDWTNYDLRTLISSLKERGVPTYAGIMGVYLDDRFHHEFLSEHPELRYEKADGERRSLHCFKRFADGAYYEDFFAEKMVRTLTDYGFAGIHLSDAFLPTGRRYTSDYSDDMIDQFYQYSGIKVPDGDRQKYIWDNCAAEWLHFYEWRHETFYKKICDAAHAAGLEVWCIGCYCTGPIESRYIFGFDARRLVKAGVDRFTPNILPTSVGLGHPNGTAFFQRIQLDLPFLRAQCGDIPLYSMLSIQDCSEEWTVIAHRPVELERDLYTMNAFEDAADGVFICLGDGVSKRDWQFLNERFPKAFIEGKKTSVSPVVVWSDAGHDAEFDAYINSRRAYSHRQATEIFKAGFPFGGTVRLENALERDTMLFAANYDLLPESEQSALSARRGPWVGTAAADFDLSGLNADFICTDGCGDEGMQAFICGCPLDDKTKSELTALCLTDNGKPSEADVPVRDYNPLDEDMPIKKLGSGFIKACGLMLAAATPYKSDMPLMVIKTERGDRLYVYNNKRECYAKARVTSARPLTAVRALTPFPVLPIKLSEDGREFEVKLPPNGVTVVEAE